MGAGLTVGPSPDSDRPFAQPYAALEYQQIIQRWVELSTEVELRYFELTRRFAEVRRQADLETFEYLASAVGDDPATLYDAWIDRAERAYAQLAHGDGFAQSLGELVNLLSKLKIERAKLLESLCRTLDLPSRAEIDTLHRRVRELMQESQTSSARAPRSRKRRERRRS